MLYQRFNIFLCIGFVSCMHPPSGNSGLSDILGHLTDDDIGRALEAEYNEPWPSWTQKVSNADDLAESSQSSDNTAFPKFATRDEFAQFISPMLTAHLIECRVSLDTGFQRVERVKFFDLFSKTEICVNACIYEKYLGNGQSARLLRVIYPRAGYAIDAYALKAPVRKLFNSFYEQVIPRLKELRLTPDEYFKGRHDAVEWLWNTFTKQEPDGGSLPVIGSIDSKTDQEKGYRLGRSQASLIGLITEYFAKPPNWDEANSKLADQLALQYCISHFSPPPLRS